MWLTCLLAHNAMIDLLSECLNDVICFAGFNLFGGRSLSEKAVGMISVPFEMISDSKDIDRDCPSILNYHPSTHLASWGHCP